MQWRQACGTASIVAKPIPGLVGILCIAYLLGVDVLKLRDAPLLFQRPHLAQPSTEEPTRPGALAGGPPAERPPQPPPRAAESGPLPPAGGGAGPLAPPAAAPPRRPAEEGGEADRKRHRWPDDSRGHPFETPMPLEMALAGVDDQLHYAPWEAAPAWSCPKNHWKHAHERLSESGEWVRRPNHTPVFGIGLHKTGTISFGTIYEKIGLKALHGTRWPRGDKTHHDAFADGGGDVFFWKDEHQFGAGSSHPIWEYLNCWPDSSLVLSIRGLSSWMISKLKHEKVRHNGTEEDDLRFAAIMARWTLFRDKFHRRILDIAMANETIASRLLIVDLPGEGSANASCALCKFLEVDCCSMRMEVHGTYPGMRLKNWTRWNAGVRRALDGALRLLHVPPDQAEAVLRRPLLSLDLVRSPEVLAWLRARGYGRFAG